MSTKLLILALLVTLGSCHTFFNRLKYLSRGSNTYLDEQGGAPQTYQFNNGDYQKWWTTEVGEDYFTIKNHRSDKFLDSNQDGQVYTHIGNGGDFQKWKFLDLGKGSFPGSRVYRIMNKATGRFLSVAKSSNIVQTVDSRTNGWGQDITKWEAVPVR